MLSMATSLAIGQLLQPKEIGQKIIDILSERLQWHHATIRQYHPESETLELLAFHQPGLENEAERLAAEERFQDNGHATRAGLCRLGHSARSARLLWGCDQRPAIYRSLAGDSFRHVCAVESWRAHDRLSQC